jgi:hypothetical protein
MRIPGLLRNLLLNVLLFACESTAQIAQPKLGAILGRDSSVREVVGVTGSVMLGRSLGEDVLSMGCSRGICLMKTDSAIVSFTGSIEAPPGPALFSFHRDGSALVYFVSTRQLVRWQSDAVSAVAFDVTGEIIAIGDGLFAVQRRSGVWIVRDGDKIVRALPHDTRAVLLLDGEAMYATRREVVMGEKRYAIQNVEALTWLAENYVQARTPGGDYAIRIDRGREQTFLLPELLLEPQP